MDSSGTNILHVEVMKRFDIHLSVTRMHRTRRKWHWILYNRITTHATNNHVDTREIGQDDSPRKNQTSRETASRGLRVLARRCERSSCLSLETSVGQRE